MMKFKAMNYQKIEFLQRAAILKIIKKKSKKYIFNQNCNWGRRSCNNVTGAPSGSKGWN